MSSSKNSDLHIVALLIWVFIEIAKFILLSTKFHLFICSLSGFGCSAIKLSPISCLTTLCWSLSSSTASPSQWRGLALTPPARWVSKELISFHLSDRCRCVIYPTNELCHHCSSSVCWCSCVSPLSCPVLPLRSLLKWCTKTQKPANNVFVYLRVLFWINEGEYG